MIIVIVTSVTVNIKIELTYAQPDSSCELTNSGLLYQASFEAGEAGTNLVFSADSQESPPCLQSSPNPNEVNNLSGNGQKHKQISQNHLKSRAAQAIGQLAKKGANVLSV